MNTSEQIALVALNNMFKKPHMDICTIRDVAKVLNVVPDTESFDQLRALHCINWSDMPRNLYLEIPNLIKKCLGDRAIHRFISVDDAPRGLTDTMVVNDAHRQIENPPTKRPLLSRWING